MEMVWQRQGERRRVWRMAALIALLLAVICVRPGFAVTVDGEALGVYAPVAVRRSIAAAEAAAREISGETVDLSSALKLQFRLTMMPRSRDLRRLERALLEAAPGWSACGSFAPVSGFWAQWTMYLYWANCSVYL